MDEIFKRLVGDNLADLSGLTIDAIIPVSEPLANEFIAAILQEGSQLEYCRLHIYQGNRVTVDVKSPRWPWPFKVKLRLFGSVDTSDSPTVRAFLENYALLGKLGSLLHALPDGIQIYEDQISIQIESFITSPEQKRLLSWVKKVEIRTEAGRIFFDIKITK